MKALALFSFIIVVSLAHAQWTDATPTSSNSLGKLSFPTDNVGYVVEPNTNIIHKTTDGGSNWTTVLVDSIADLVDVHFVSSQVGYAVSNPAFPTSFWNVAKTTDGGTTWTPIAPGILPFNNIFFKDQNTGFVTTRYGSIYHTTNGGVTWNQVQNQNYHEYVNLAVVGDTIVLAGWDGTFAYRGILAKSTDAGVNWTVDTIQEWYSTINAVSILNSSKGFYTEGLWGNASGGNLYRSTDGFSTTDSVIQPATNIHDIHFTSATNGILIGDSGAIYSTSNGGQTYTKEYQHGDMQSLRYIESTIGRTYVSGDNVLLRKDGATGMKDQLEVPAFNFFPNPTKNNITLELQQQANVQLINGLGQSVWTQEVAEGSHLIIFPELTSGTYLLRVGKVSQRLLVIQ